MFPLSLWYWDSFDLVTPPFDPPTSMLVPARQLKTWWRINEVVFDSTNTIIRMAVDNQFFQDEGRLLKELDYLGIPYGDRIYAFQVEAVIPYFGQGGVLQNLYVLGVFAVDFLIV